MLLRQTGIITMVYKWEQHHFVTQTHFFIEILFKIIRQWIYHTIEFIIFLNLFLCRFTIDFTCTFAACLSLLWWFFFVYIYRNLAHLKRLLMDFMVQILYFILMEFLNRFFVNKSDLVSEFLYKLGTIMWIWGKPLNSTNKVLKAFFIENLIIY